MKSYHLIDAFIDSELRSAMMPYESYNWAFHEDGTAHVSFEGKLTDSQAVNAAHRFFVSQLSLRDQFDKAVSKGASVTIALKDGQIVVKTRKSRNLTASEKSVVLKFATCLKTYVEELCARLRGQIEQIRAGGLDTVQYSSAKDVGAAVIAIARVFEVKAA